MTKEEITAFLNTFEDSSYDARETHNVRFIDQKCTPDIVCFTADCILSTDCKTKEFTKTDLWRTSYFKENTRVVYHKPYSDDKKASKEYDKIASQPLNLLASAHVLSREKKKNAWYYKINNIELLEYIARKERCAVDFLFSYFTKIIQANDLQAIFDEYKRLCSAKRVSEAHATLYRKFRQYIKANSGITNDNEPDRMLHKIINVIAIIEQIPGSSKKVPALSDILYNRVNTRDRNKVKELTRSEANPKSENERLNEEHFLDYQANKAKRKVKNIQGTVSEVDDELKDGDATQVHHIFPKAEYPSISAHFENLILLTPSQHLTKAHPQNNTQIICRDYQFICLMSKSTTIENYLADRKGDFYSRERFIEVINIGLDTSLDRDSNFYDIRATLWREYNTAS